MPPAPASAAATKQAQAIAEEDAAINVRVLSQMSSNVKGKPPLFKALAQSFLAVTDAATSGSIEDTVAAQRAFMTEMDNLELQLNRFHSANEANVREQEGYAAKLQALEAQIQQAVADIETKKQELQAARVVRQHNEEYEVIRSLIAEQPQRETTQAAIDEERRRIDALRAEQRRHAAVLEHKRRTFALLLQCVDELSRTGGDEDGVDAAALGSAGGGGPAAMQVD